MRLELFGKKEFVRRVNAERIAGGSLHVMITLEDRWGPLLSRIGSNHFIPRPGEEGLRHDALVFSDPDAESAEDESLSEVEVVLVAETVDESRLFQRSIRYFCHEKDQFSVLYVPSSSMEVVEPLVNVFRINGKLVDRKGPKGA